MEEDGEVLQELKNEEYFSLAAEVVTRRNRMKLQC